MNLKGRTVLLLEPQSSYYNRATLSLFTEREASAAAGGEACVRACICVRVCVWGVAVKGGGWMGEKKRVITQTTIFTHFTLSGSVSQGKRLLGFSALSAASQTAPADLCKNSSPPSLTPSSLPGGYLPFAADTVKGGRTAGGDAKR